MLMECYLCILCAEEMHSSLQLLLSPCTFVARHFQHNKANFQGVNHGCWESVVWSQGIAALLCLHTMTLPPIRPSWVQVYTSWDVARVHHLSLCPPHNRPHSPHSLKSLTPLSILS